MADYFDFSYMISTFPRLLAYVHITVFITLVSAVVGIVLGCLVAIARINRVKGLSQFLTVYVSFMRGTPFMVQLFLVYFGVPEILLHLGFNAYGLPPLLFVLSVFILHMAAYGSEIMRSSIEAVGAGEKEAAASLGMTPFQGYTRVVLPQALALAVPPLINTILSVLKGTALIFNVGIIDIMRAADLLGGNSQRYLELFLNVAIIYGILVFLITQAGGLLEMKFDVAHHGSGGREVEADAVYRNT